MLLCAENNPEYPIDHTGAWNCEPRSQIFCHYDNYKSSSCRDYSYVCDRSQNCLDPKLKTIWPFSGSIRGRRYANYYDSEREDDYDDDDNDGLLFAQDDRGRLRLIPQYIDETLCAYEDITRNVSYILILI